MPHVVISYQYQIFNLGLLTNELNNQIHSQLAWLYVHCDPRDICWYIIT